MECVGIFHNMKICILGHTGFVGQTVYKYMSKSHHVQGINSKTKSIPTGEFDVVINCAGSSKKYLAHENPSKDFYINASVFSTVLKLNMKKFIHISSIDAGAIVDNNYTRSKLAMEECVQLYFPDATILRLGGMIGDGLKKNVIYDIINNQNLHITFDSICNYISTQEVAKIIEKVIDLNIKKITITVASSKPITVKEIIKEAKKKSIPFDKNEGSKKENYDQVNLEELNKLFNVKDSEHYIEEYLKRV